MTNVETGYEIRMKGEKVLMERCLPCTESIPTVLSDELKVLMAEKNGCGLSANQVGINKRFFIAKIDGKICVFHNPFILSHGKSEVETPEGCLSILDEFGAFIYKPKSRWEVIDVEYRDKDFKLIRTTLKRREARIFQHELDHLEGRFCQ